MSNSILASLRESFPESDFTLAATSGGSTTIATNYYYWVNGYSRGGMNLLTSLGQVSVSIGQKLVWTVTNIAPGDDVFGFILSASTTNDPTTAKILAIAPAKASNQETLIPAPLAIELTHDSHFGLGITSALPTSNLLNGMIRYADGQYQQYSSQLNDWEVVNGWSSYLASTTSPLVTGVYKNGCDVPILSNESIIPLADYTGGTSTRFRLALQNGLTEGSGSILPTGSKIALNILLENNEAFAAQYLNEGQVQINPVHIIRRSDGTVTALDDSTLVWEWGKPFYTLTSDLLRGYAIAFDITVVNATLPQGSNLTFYLSEYGRISERVQSTGAGSLIYNGGDRLRIYPAQIGVLRGTGNGLLEVTGETYSYPVNASSRDFFASGLQPNTAAQIVALSGLTNGEITFRSNVNQLLATEKIRAIASTQSVTVTPSAWVSIGSVSANQVINVTITYPCDAEGIGTIRSDYPDVIAGSAIGEFNPDKLRVFLRKNGTTITETTAIAVTPGPSQGFIITDVGTTATIPPNTANNLGFWDYGTITTTPSGSSSNLTAGTYEICVAYQYEGNTVVSLSHATIDGCLPELEYDLATAIAKAGYFSKVYESETLKPQLEGLNFANNWFTVTQNGTKLDVELTGVARMWPVASPPGATFDESDGVQKGDSARLTVPPYDIYDCLDPTTGASVWKKRSFFSESYNDLSDKPTLGSAAALDTGSANGVCPLNGSGKVDSSYLPSYVDDVVEYADLASLPITGEAGKIYITLNTNRTYRWSGLTYVEISNPFSGSYNDLSDKPTLGTAAALNVGTSANNVVQLDNTGKLPAVDGSQLTGITGSGGGHTIQDEGVSLTQRSKLNFVGGGVEVTDNAGTDTTTVTITGSAGNTFPDNVFRIQDNTDSTKQLAFETSGITTGTTRTLTVPDSNGTVLSTDTLTDKALYYYDASSKLFKPVGIGTLDQVLVAKPSSNPPYQWATPVYREMLTSNRTYYVRTNGNDSNNGLADTAGGAFLTFSKALSTIATLDGNGYNVIIKATGTFTSGVTINQSFVGISSLTIDGDTTTPSNTTINVSSGTCLTANCDTTIVVQGIKFLNSSSSGNAITLSRGRVDISSVDFGAVGSSGRHLFIGGGILNVLGNYTISGGAYEHAVAQGGVSVYQASSKTITITNTPNFSGQFISANTTGSVIAYLVTFSGSATGKRYDVTANAAINTYGGGANYFPGNFAGTTATGGQYI